MSKETEFYIYLIERYADFKNVTADVVQRQWDEYGVSDMIFNMYDIYHVERLQNAFDDIDKMIEEKLVKEKTAGFTVNRLNNK